MLRMPVEFSKKPPYGLFVSLFTIPAAEGASIGPAISDPGHRACLQCCPAHRSVLRVYVAERGPQETNRPVFDRDNMKLRLNPTAGRSD